MFKLILMTLLIGINSSFAGYAGEDSVVDKPFEFSLYEIKPNSGDVYYGLKVNITRNGRELKNLIVYDFGLKLTLGPYGRRNSYEEFTFDSEADGLEFIDNFSSDDEKDYFVPFTIKNHEHKFDKYFLIPKAGSEITVMFKNRGIDNVNKMTATFSAKDYTQYFCRNVPPLKSGKSFNLVDCEYRHLGTSSLTSDKVVPLSLFTNNNWNYNN